MEKIADVMIAETQIQFLGAKFNFFRNVPYKSPRKNNSSDIGVKIPTNTIRAKTPTGDVERSVNPLLFSSRLDVFIKQPENRVSAG